jgi:predicted dehydrogenase
MARQITVGVVGCGYWGPNLIRNFRSVVGCRLKLMCDTNEKRLAHVRSLYPEVEGNLDFKHTLNGACLTLWPRNRSM